MGMPRNKIAVGGFSQGGAIALLTAYYSSPPSHPERKPLAACACLSGWLPLSGDMSVANVQTPLFWAHGQYDDKVLFAQQKFGVEKLSNAGVSNLDFPSFPMGHESCHQEILELADFLENAIFGETVAEGTV